LTETSRSAPPPCRKTARLAEKLPLQFLICARHQKVLIKQKVPEGSTIYSDSFRSYDGLLTDGYRHYRINHGKGQFAKKRNHINGIGSFWTFAETKLRWYYGVRRSHFFLYLKEMEFRFNHRHENIEVVITKIL